MAYQAMSLLARSYPRCRANRLLSAVQTFDCMTRTIFIETTMLRPHLARCLLALKEKVLDHHRGAPDLDPYPVDVMEVMVEGQGSRHALKRGQFISSY